MTMRRLLLVVNPKAQGVSARSSIRVEQELEQGFEVRIVHTRGRGHGEELAATGVREGAELVVAYGGDGTVNEVVNALAGTDVPFGVVPGGGANIFARALGMPWNDVRSAAHLATGDGE